jgi:agmatine/peptidylarginine deiminase
MLGDWVSACAPGEFETQAALMLGLNEFLLHAPQIPVDIVSALIDHIPLIGIVTSEEQRRQAVMMLSDWGLPAHLLQFVFMPVRGMWVRDYGPTFARWSDGSVMVLDAEYAGGDRPNDDRVPTDLASLLKVPVTHVPLAAEGGNILSNGRGLCLTSRALLERNMNRGYREHEISAILSDYYGFCSGMFLAPLKRELTGHVDMFATFVSSDVVMLGSYDPTMDAENARLLDRNAEALRGVSTRDGPLKVVRIPMPSNTDGVFRTYTNVVYANGRVLVPSYPEQDAELERKAMAVFAQVLPEWRIIPIDCEAMIRQCGALRCATLNIPWLADRFELPTGPVVPASAMRA